MASNSQYIYLIMAAPLLLMGAWEAMTGRATSRNGRGGRYYRRATHEYVLEDVMIVIIGWAKILWGGLLCLIWAQALQKIHPGVFDMIKTLAKTTKDNNVFTGLFVVSMILLVSSSVLAQTFGEKREL